MLFIEQPIEAGKSRVTMAVICTTNEVGLRVLSLNYYALITKFKGLFSTDKPYTITG
jgi:hypothetical protein